MKRRTRAILAASAVGLTAAVLLQLPAGAAARKHVDTDHTLLRRAPYSYVVGTAYRGWTVDVQQETSGGYRWGRVYGSLNRCLWTYSGALSGSGSKASSCSSTVRTMTEKEFARSVNTGAEDGTGVTVRAGSTCRLHDGTHITGYGNVRPWQSTTRASERVPTQVAIGQKVLWRYVSRDGEYAMVRDPRAGDTDGKGVQGWYFIDRTCLPSSLPNSRPPRSS